MNTPDTPRSLFLKILHFEPCRRTLKWGICYWGGALNRWYTEGLPKFTGLPRPVDVGDGIKDWAGMNGSLSFAGDFPLVDHDVNDFFSLPRYRRLIGQLRAKRVEHFFVDSDGNLNGLIPLFMEAGITIVYPHVSWENFRYYREKLNHIIGTTRVL